MARFVRLADQIVNVDAIGYLQPFGPGGGSCRVWMVMPAAPPIVVMNRRVEDVLADLIGDERAAR